MLMDLVNSFPDEQVLQFIDIACESKKLKLEFWEEILKLCTKRKLFITNKNTIQYLISEEYIHPDDMESIPPQFDQICKN